MMLSSSDVLSLPLIRSSYVICFRTDGDVPIMSLSMAQKTSLSLAFILFAYSTDAEFHPLVLANALSCPLIGLAFVTPTLCLISLELKVISYERSVLSVNVILVIGQTSCIHLPSALNKRSVLDDLISDW